MDPIVDAALKARTRADIEQLEKMLGAAGLTKIRYLGDQEANWSSMSSPAEPTSVIFERPTNMFDAIIEMEAERRGEFGCQSPAEAVRSFFGVPSGGIAEMGQAAREKLAEYSLVQLLDSDDPVRKPTLAFRDLGIGVSPAWMPDTILSLQKSNKLRKPYTNGIFGKGGSSANVFSDGTVIVSRRQPDLLGEDEEDRITVAVVREDSAPDMGLPFYRYLVSPTTELPYSVPASAHPTFEPGTYVAHINYQAGLMGRQNWLNEESIYAFAETILLEPTLPYQLQDARSDRYNVRPADRREPSVLSGLGQRLDQLKPKDGTILDRSEWQTVAVPDVGEVRLRWWLFEDIDRRRTRVAKGFVVVFTTNGQIHHAWDNARLQQLVDNRRRVGQRLFVQVDCDGIELRKRYKVFDSFRAQVRRGPEGRALEDAVADQLASDPDLDEFESVFTRQSLASAAQKVSAAFRNRLNRALRMKIPGLAPVPGKGKGGKPPKAKAAEDLYEEPTTMTGPSELTLLIGGRAVVFLEINAVDGFIPNRGDIEVEGWPYAAPGKGDLRKGRLALTFNAPPGAPESAITVEVVLTWLRKVGGLGRIAWPMLVKVVETIEPSQPSKPTSKDQPKKDGGDVAFIWVTARDHGWDETVVGDLEMMKGDDLAAAQPDTYSDLRGVDELLPTIVLNRDFADWAAYKRSIASRASDATLDVRNERYGLAVGVTVANIVVQEKKISEKYEKWQARQNGTEEPPPAMTEEQRQRAFAEAARGVIALMPDIDQLMGDLEAPAA